MSADRLDQLESRFAWLERHVLEQDKAMVGLADEVRRVREQLQRLRARVQGSGGEAPEPPDEKPPHY
jgi:SlyX protein